MDPNQHQQLMAALNHVTGYLERIARAIEQVSLEMDKDAITVTSSPASETMTYSTSGGTFRSNPQVVPLKAEWTCPVHGTGARHVEAGISKATGKHYDAFDACATPFCKERPPRGLAAQLP